MIGGYGSGIKRLLPQPLRRVRHSLPPALLFLPSPPPFLLHLLVLFERKRKERPTELVHGFLPHLLLPLPASLRLCSLPARCRVCTLVCDLQVAGSVALMLPCSVVLWLLAVSSSMVSGLLLSVGQGLCSVGCLLVAGMCASSELCVISLFSCVFF